MQNDLEKTSKTKKFYLTTPLYYVNASPHIGHAYTNIAADVLARYKRLAGNEVFFLTGTDEHGQKIKLASQQQNISVEEFVDAGQRKFRDLWRVLDISYDDFIRTTEIRHTETVQKVLSILKEKADVYEDTYEGWYCIPCETFWPARQIENNICPDCQRPLEQISEKNYFFRLSKYQKWLIDYIERNEDFIKPLGRRNEILQFLNSPLNDLCISRPKKRFAWGIECPFDKDHVTYVWFDALINYISAVGFACDEEKFKKFWPADIQVIGKDILRQHAVYWPIMLKALDLAMPKLVFAHGWWTVSGEKISKSRGNAVDPQAAAKNYGIDCLRYFLLREINFGFDGVYSETAIIQRYNSDLANDLGNLLNRSLTMIEKYFDGKLPEIEKENLSIIEKLKTETEIAPGRCFEGIELMDFRSALISIWDLINTANKFIEDVKPWVLAKEDTGGLRKVIYGLYEVLRFVSILIWPFMPSASRNIRRQMGLREEVKGGFTKRLVWGLSGPGVKIIKEGPLFPRIKV